MIRRGDKWSPVEINYLKKNKDKPLSELAGMLARSVSAVKRKLETLEKSKRTTTKQGVKQGVKNERSYIGKRADLGGQFFRSCYEANAARYFNYKGWQWEFEPEYFVFEGIKRGQTTYIPDFRITRKKGKEKQVRWVEVKGYMDPASKTKLRRFKKFFPEEFDKLIVVCRGPNTKTYQFCQKLGVNEIITYQEIERIRDKLPNFE